MPEALDLPRARHRLYGLLGQLLADGLSDANRPIVESLPALAALTSPDAEVLATEHTRWFGFELSPHESAFLDGALNGPATAAVRATWTACGFATRRTDLEPDHLAMHLGALSFLCAGELEARQDGVDPAPILVLQQRVTAHLVGWLPLLVDAVQGPWRAPLDLLEELVLDHHGGTVDDRPVADEPATPDLLLTPDRCGWVCTWTALHAASEQSGCALGFGSKRRAVRALLDAPEGREALAVPLDVAAPGPWMARRKAAAHAVKTPPPPRPEP